jgi:hypothetical protein
MPRLSRKLRVCKWVGTIGCVLIVMVFVASLWWVATCCLFWRTGLYALTIVDGGIAYGADYAAFAGGDGIDTAWVWGLQPRTSQKGPAPSILWRIRFFSDLSFVAIPLWLPFLILLIPTLLLWRRDRKPRPGFCRQCDYDLTGNISGRCPECGTPIAP